MTTTPFPRLGTPEHRTWLLDCAARLEAEGQHDLAAEARLEAEAPAPAPAAPARSVRCDDCGRPVSVAKMPDDWPLDWWSHSAATGRRCTA